MNRSFSVFKVLNCFSPNLFRLAYNGPKGIEYYGFTYYPRFENFKDPPITPSKLFLIKRKKDKPILKKEKEILAQLLIDGPRKLKLNCNIVTNTPEVNALLWQVKHLITIKPITWKGDLPKDFSGTYLRETGELVISPKLDVSKKSEEESVKVTKSKHSYEYMKSHLLSKWVKGYDLY